METTVQIKLKRKVPSKKKGVPTTRGKEAPASKVNWGKPRGAQAQSSWAGKDLESPVRGKTLFYMRRSAPKHLPMNVQKVMNNGEMGT